jgi:hypothetical protein
VERDAQDRLGELGQAVRKVRRIHALLLDHLANFFQDLEVIDVIVNYCGDFDQSLSEKLSGFFNANVIIFFYNNCVSDHNIGPETETETISSQVNKTQFRNLKARPAPACLSWKKKYSFN